MLIRKQSEKKKKNSWMEGNMKLWEIKSKKLNIGNIGVLQGLHAYVFTYSKENNFKLYTNQ